MFDGKAFGEAIVDEVRAFVERATAPLLDRIAELEAREIPVAIKGDPGESVEAEQVAEMVREAVSAAVEPAVAIALDDAVAALPAPEKGEPGEGVDIAAVRADVAAMVAEQIERGLSAIPGPAKGDPGDRGEDGAGIADLLIDRDGDLIATFTDGRMKNLGQIVGKDGNPGKPGEAGRSAPGPEDYEFELQEDGRTLRMTIGRADDPIAYAHNVKFPVTIYRGDHADGVEFEEGDMVGRDGALWIALADTAATPGESKDWRLAVARGADGAVPYAGEARGLYDPASEYRAMDVVSFNGSEWRAKQDDPGELPGDGWMLSASKGKKGDRGDPGKTGRVMPMIVASYFDSATAQHVITMDDGTEHRADLAPLLATLREGMIG